VSPIARLKGVIQERGLDWIIVDVGGIGFLVHVPANLAGQHPAGGSVELYTHLLWREEGIGLYGFATGEEQRLFQMLIGVSGVGPKVALGLLSVLGPEALSQAIASGDTEVLARAPGVGRKLAGRIVLELRGKLAAVAPAALPASDRQVVAALTSLGYSQAEALEAMTRAELPPGASLEDKVRLALRYFAGGRPRPEQAEGQQNPETLT